MASEAPDRLENKDIIHFLKTHIRKGDKPDDIEYYFESFSEDLKALYVKLKSENPTALGELRYVINQFLTADQHGFKAEIF